LLSIDIITGNQYMNSFGISGKLGGFREAIYILYRAPKRYDTEWRWTYMNILGYKFISSDRNFISFRDASEAPIICPQDHFYSFPLIF